MASNNHFNLDTVKFRVTARDVEFKIPKTRFSVILDEDYEFENERQFGIKVPGAYGNHNIVISSPNSGRSLIVEGALAGFLYGQNFFTTHQLLPLVIQCLKRACKEIEFSPSAEQRTRWEAGKDIFIELVDIAVNFGLGSETTVDSGLRQARAQALFRNFATGAHGKTCYIKPDNGRSWEAKFYGKRSEMTHSGRHERLPIGAQLFELSDGVLRAEVRAKRAELSELKLASLAAWSETSAKEIFVRRYKQCDLKKITSGPIEESELRALPMRLRVAYCMHKLAGATGLEELVFGKRTRQRQLAAFRERGVDLACPNLEGIETVDLPSLLVPSNALVVPKWLVEGGFAPDLKKETYTE